MRVPGEKRRQIEEAEEIGKFLLQSNISEKNMCRLEELVTSDDARVASMAKLLLEIGKLHPRKRRRVKFLVRERRDLLARLEQLSLDLYLPY